MSRPTVLTLVDYYLPGYKAGGPAVSVSRIVQRYGRDFDFRVFTRDRDLGDTMPYPDIETNRWLLVDGAPRYYASPSQFAAPGLRTVVNEVGPDIVYANSYFSKITRAALAARAGGTKLKLVIAPRGEFSLGALAQKRIKKAAYLWLANHRHIHRDVLWHVSSELELADVSRVIGQAPRHFIVAPDLLDSDPPFVAAGPVDKCPGEVRLIFVSRISPKKNLDGALKMLEMMKGTVTFEVVGPEEDASYARQCRALADHLPPNVKVHFRGGLPPSRVAEEFAKAHFFLFPTHGENFGHVIAESLSVGCPVLTTDQTPWSFPDGGGRVMPLADAAAWRATLAEVVAMDGKTYAAMRIRARSSFEGAMSDGRVGSGFADALRTFIAS